MKKYYKIIYVIALVYCTYQFVLQSISIFRYSTNLGFSEGVLGHPVSLGWSFLVLLYWFFWIAGLIGVLSRKPVGWILLMPVTLMGVIYVLIVVAKESGREMIFALSQLLVLIGITVLINHRSTFDELSISSKGKYYIGAIGLFILFGSLFLLTNKHYMP